MSLLKPYLNCVRNVEKNMFFILFQPEYPKSYEIDDLN